MKKLLLITAIGLFLCSSKSFGQNNNNPEFAPIGAQWWEDGDGELQVGASETSSMYYYNVTGDSIVAGHNARVIHQRQYIFEKVFSTVPGHLLGASVTQNDADFYLYGNNDTEFVYNQNFNQFTPLYVFNVNEGDTVCLPVFSPNDMQPNPYAGGDTCFCFIIDSIRTVLYDTTYLQTFFEHSIVGDWDTTPVENWSTFLQQDTPVGGSYARVIGSTYGGLLPRKIMEGVIKPTNDSFVYQPPYYRQRLRCYVDSNITIHIEYNDTTGCFFDTTATLGVQNVQPLSKLIKVYPNPARESIHLLVKKPFREPAILYLSDAAGRVLKTISVDKGTRKITLQVAHFPAGIYYLHLHQQHGQYGQKVVILQQ